MKYDLDYLQSLIVNKVEENINLDYKAAGALQRTDSKTKEISKDVSAFANSNGGLIIYGIREGSTDETKHLPESIDPIDRSVINKEWLEQIIHGRIQPRVEGIKIYSVEIDGNDVVYIVDIPQSKVAHQAVDKKYYKRFNFLSEAMHDYEIKDIMNRGKHPSIELRFEVHHKVIHNDLSAFGHAVTTRHTYDLKVFAKNNGKVLANYVYCDISFPENCLKDNYKRDGSHNLITVKTNNLINADNLKYHPILPNLEIELKLDGGELHEHYGDSGNNLRWTVYADNANPVTGEVSFGGIKPKRVYS